MQCMFRPLHVRSRARETRSSHNCSREVEERHAFIALGDRYSR
jgi:hypothetical protein